MQHRDQRSREPVRYQDFAIRIEPAKDGGYFAQVLSSSGGGARTPIALPFPPDRLPALLRSLEYQVRRSGPGLGRDLKPPPDPVAATTPRAFGGALYDALFSGGVRDAYQRSLERAERDAHTGLRIRLVIDPELAGNQTVNSLPWELLYQREANRFLSHGHLTPVVRRLQVPFPVDPVARPVERPLRVLVVLSNPRAWPPLDLDRERRNIEAACAGAGHEVMVLEKPTLAKLRSRLRDRQPHILHFMGHGTFDDRTHEGQLVLETEAGDAAPVTGEQLAVTLQDIRSIRMALLVACDSARHPRHHGVDPYSGVAASLIRGGLGAVAAMQFPISDRAAIAFSGAFYASLAAGDLVDAAVADARQAIYSDNHSSYEWATPVLFLRVDDVFPIPPDGTEQTSGGGRHGPPEPIAVEDLDLRAMLLLARRVHDHAAEILTGEVAENLTVPLGGGEEITASVNKVLLESGDVLCTLAFTADRAAAIEAGLADARKKKENPIFAAMAWDIVIRSKQTELNEATLDLRDQLMGFIRGLQLKKRKRS